MAQALSLKMFDGKFSLLKLNYLAWFVYFCIFNLYCVVWRQYGLGIGYSVGDSLLWFFKEWGGWLLVSAFLLLSLDKLIKSRFKLAGIIAVSVLSLFIVIWLRILVDSGEFSGVDVGTITVSLFPKYFTALAAIISLWYFYSFVRKPHIIESQNNSNSEHALSQQHEFSKSVIVEHLGVLRTIEIADIISVKAARNYVEIEGVNNSYIKRSSLKQLLDELTGSSLMQVHRSYALNLNNLTQIVNGENGSAIALMSNEQRIPVSKSYKAALKAISL